MVGLLIIAHLELVYITCWASLLSSLKRVAQGYQGSNEDVLSIFNFLPLLFDFCCVPRRNALALYIFVMLIIHWLIPTATFWANEKASIFIPMLQMENWSMKVGTMLSQGQSRDIDLENTLLFIKLTRNFTPFLWLFPSHILYILQHPSLETTGLPTPFVMCAFSQDRFLPIFHLKYFISF